MAFLAGFAACGPIPSAAPRPNILIYLLDTVRADHLPTYGYRRRTAPEIDRLAEDSVVFINAFAQSSWTKPAVASLFTARHPISHQVNTWNAVLADSEDTLSEILARNAYTTAAASANELISPRFGFDQGFEIFAQLGKMDQIASPRLTDGALRWLDRRQDDDPFFLYVHSTDAHAPYTPPQESLERLGVEVEDPQLGQTEARKHYSSDAGLDPERRSVIRRELQALYDGEIAFNSGELGRLIEGLRERALYASTLIVVLSDHGEEFYDHGYLGHGDSLYIEQLRIPLVVKFPQSWQAGRRIEDPVRQVDLLPSLLDYLGLPISGRVEGSSFLPLLETGATRSSPPAIFSFLDAEEGKRYESVILGRHHLIRGRDSLDQPIRSQLYNLSVDPLEQDDLFFKDREIAERLGALLDSQLARPLDPDVTTRSLDAESMDRLRALGYIGGSN